MESNDAEKDIVGAGEQLETSGVHPLRESESGTAEDQVTYVEGIPLILLITGLVIAVFVISMDFTILATAIPKITTEFHSVDDVGWYGSVYLLTTTAFQPWFGKLYTLFNAKLVYLTAMAIFEVGSIISATSTTSLQLIIGRAVSGVGASAIFSGGATIIGYSVRLQSRSIYLGILSSMFGMASTVGPLLGGAFTTNATWRWCFWINLPLGGIAMLVVFLYFKPPRNKTSGFTSKAKLLQIDYLGTVLLIGAIVSLLLALQFGGNGSWSEGKVYGSLIAFAGLLFCFLLVEYKLGDSALVPLHLFSNRTVWSASLLSGFLIMSMYDHVYYLPFYFQATKGYNAALSGVCSIPYFISLSIASIGSGFVIAKTGSYVEFAWVGTAILTIGAGFLSTIKVDSQIGTWIGYQIVCGFGVGLAIQTPFIAVQTVVVAAQMPLGMAIVVFFNSLGGSLSISIAQNIFIEGLRKEIPKYTTGVNADQIISGGATNVTQNVLPSQRDGLLFAYNLAIENTLKFAIAAAGIAFLVSLFVERRKTTQDAVNENREMTA